MRTGTRFFLLALALLLPAARLTAQAERGAGQAFDLLIRGGAVLDGTGNPSFRADVGIRDGRIVAVGRLDLASAGRVIDATGKVIAPGFIDIHSHADETSPGARGTLRDPDPRRRSAPNLVTQGITTVVVNQDGRSVWPIREQKATMERLGIGPNAILLVGHGEVRRRAMGDDFRRPATAAEIRRMRELVREGLRDGAWGLSAGLEYVPGRWSTTDEVVALVEEIVPWNGIYISHERSEGADPMWYWPSQDPAGPPTLLDAVMETIEIGERTGATVVASHVKAKGAHYWGTGAAVIQLIEQARARGVQVWADQYPYETTGTDGNTVLIPDWALARRSGGAADHSAALRAVMADPAANAKLRQDIAHEIRRRGGAAKVIIFDHPVTEFVGKSLADVAKLRDLGEVDMALTLQLEGDPARPGGGRARGFSLSELDIEMYAAKNWVATATDGGIALPEDGPSTHARFYGTFPRKIRRYALDAGVLTLEDAIRSATSLPARILGLEDRGMVRAGFAADLVVFDVNRIRDTATFFEPHQYAEGIDHVLIGGQAVVENGMPTGALPGTVLTPAVRPRA
jgi:N-acyl-D-aspartate/D-glutamate deacylase